MLDRTQVWGPGRPVNEAGYMSCIRRKPAYGQTVEALIAHSVSMTLSHLLHVINLPLSISQWASASFGVLWKKLFMGALCEDWHTDWWRNRFRGCLRIQCLHKDTFMNVLWKSLGWNQQPSHLCSDFTNWVTVLQLPLPVSWCNPPPHSW